MTPAGLSLPAIPWAHETSEFGSVWKWETTHFVVTVTGDRRSCYYTIGDRSAGPNTPVRPFADGQTPSFEQAERLIRETIGKAYKPTLGYSQYAGTLATTFELGNSQRVDLGIYLGQDITVTVTNSNGNATVYDGIAKIQHYDLILERGGTAIRITPSHISDIRLSTRQAPVAGKPRANRTVIGRIEAGCTGQPGFMPGSVDHTGRVCPVHEETI
jgi:hypothetical protein